MIRCSRLRYAEDRDGAVGCGDLDLSDERLDQGLALAVVAGRDDVGDMTGDPPQGSGRRRGGFCGNLAGEFVSAGTQLC
jgi:hypothetical protein